ncbi:hypothetical protein F5Y00DRAFT_268520 [Daldinia vernicosa]|uniref:uncharacterized protein n=1 Tax=Daldinia vernicosa TaxID=114800 RepID=UPI0020089307|nr:uncharacterized protein F5Y00DRAFT_268520 [Daldinia vernicosa]KAI0850407.1 hypothetical protein F5Y00DRAFT_268520 [Daldinia vernicosa]
MSVNNEDHTTDILNGALIAAGTVLGIILCIGATVISCEYYIRRKTTKLPTQDLEARTQAREQASQQPPPSYANDFSGFDFSSSPYSGSQVPLQPTVSEPAHQPVQEPNGRPTTQRQQTTDSAMGTPELRRKPAYTNIANGERERSPRSPPLTHPDDFELEEVNLRGP